MVKPVAPRPPARPPGKKLKSVPIADRRARLFAKFATTKLRQAQVAKRTPEFALNEPVHLSVRKTTGFGSYAFIGSEELALIEVKDDGSLVFVPCFPASFIEVVMSTEKALELLANFMPWWTHFEANVELEVNDAMAEQTVAAAAEQLVLAKETNSEYGTW